MDNLENIPEELFDLLSRKTFEELTASEKEMVAEHMETGEYDQYRMIIHDFTELDNSLEVKPSNKRFTRTSESAIRKLLNYKIPLYQAASVLLLFGFFTYGYFGTDRLERAADDQFSTIPSVITDKETINKIKEKVIDERLRNLKEVVNVKMDTMGKSLEKEEYPRELIFNL